jgi:hypothetical protein
MIDDAGGIALEQATRVLADARRQCAEMGLTPRQFAEILLPEALLACMVSGMKQEEAEALFGDFARDEIPEWFLRVKKTSGFCDCAREAFAEHAAGCASLVTTYESASKSAAPWPEGTVHL